MTFASGYEFRVAQHITNTTTSLLWNEADRALIEAAASEYLQCYSGITQNVKDPPASEKSKHFGLLDDLTKLLRDDNLPNRVRLAFLNAMDLLHLSIASCHSNPGLSISLAVVALEAGADCFFSGSKYTQFLSAEEQTNLNKVAGFKQQFQDNYNCILTSEDNKVVSLMTGATKSFFSERYYTKRKFLRFCEKFAPSTIWNDPARHPY
ncbi:MAG: hypothetical protein ACK52U_11165 [Synechococcaceae cyanobacterium]|jgi:hypothetical protein